MIMIQTNNNLKKDNLKKDNLKKNNLKKNDFTWSMANWIVDFVILKSVHRFNIFRDEYVD